MNYQDNEEGLVQLFQKLEYVHGTFPPVYMVGTIIIGYDKLGRIKVMVDTQERPPEKKPEMLPALSH